MNASLHGGDGDVAGSADDHAPSVSDGGGLRKRRDLFVRNRRGIGDGVGEGAEAGAENEADLGSNCGALQDELCGGISLSEEVRHLFPTIRLQVAVAQMAAVTVAVQPIIQKCL